MTYTDLVRTWAGFPEAAIETIRATIESRHDRDEEIPLEVLQRGATHAVLAAKLTRSEDPEDIDQGIMSGFAVYAIIRFVKEGCEAAKMIAKLVEVLG